MDKSTMIPKKDLEAALARLQVVPRRCQQIIDIWKDVEIDINKHGLGLMTDFAAALSMEISFSLHSFTKEESTPEDTTKETP